MPFSNFTKDNAVLVHIRFGIPETPYLRSGISNYKSASGHHFNHQELKKQLLPLSIARHTLHFSLSHVVPSHAGHSQNQNVVIIIPLSTLTEDKIQKFLGTPEDIFLFTDMLNLAGSTLLIPKSMVKEYKTSKFKAMLTNKIKCYSYADGLSLDKAFVNYAEKSNLPYLTPNSFSNPNDSESSVEKYKITYIVQGTSIKDANEIDNVSSIFGSLFQKQHFVAEHSVHKLHHIEIFLKLLTELILHDAEINLESVFQHCPHLKELYGNFKEFKSQCLGQGSKIKPEIVKKLFPGYSTFPYDGNEKLLKLFNESILEMFQSKTLKEITNIIKNYHQESLPYFNTLPELLGYREQLIIGDGNCMYNAVIAALNTDDNRKILIKYLGTDTNNWLANLRSLVASNIRPMLEEEGGDTLREHILQTVRQSADFQGETDVEAVEFYIDTVREVGANNWGDHVVLREIARIFDLHIHVHREQSDINVGEGNRVIHLFQHGEIHYDAYVAVEETRLQMLDQIAMDLGIDNNITDTNHPLPQEDDFTLPGSAFAHHSCCIQ